MAHTVMSKNTYKPHPVSGQSTDALNLPETFGSVLGQCKINQKGDEISDVFRYFDEDRTGKIKINLLKQILSGNISNPRKSKLDGESLLSKEIRDIIEEIGDKKTGMIDYNEFIFKMIHHDFGRNDDSSVMF